MWPGPTQRTDRATRFRPVLVHDSTRLYGSAHPAVPIRTRRWPQARLQLIALERGCCPKLRMSRKHSPPPASFSARRTADESAMIWVWPPAPPQRRTATPLSSFATMEFHVLRLLPSVGAAAARQRPFGGPFHLRHRSTLPQRRSRLDWPAADGIKSRRQSMERP